jgi:hypothetical protein
MSPAAVEIPPQVVDKNALPAKITHREPLKATGALDAFDQFDVTPVIGREFPTANLADWFNSPNADQLLRDLAITSKV